MTTEIMLDTAADAPELQPHDEIRHLAKRHRQIATMLDELARDVKEKCQPYYPMLETSSSFAVEQMRAQILALFDWSRPCTDCVMTATDVLRMTGYDRPSKSQTNAGSAILAKLTGKKSRKSNGQRVFDLPPKKSDIHA